MIFLFKSRKVNFSEPTTLTDYVATRWYRSPELLLTGGYYGPEVDYWAVGCIMGELADGNPLFPGENETDQLHCIIKVLGNLPEDQINMFYNNPIYAGKKLIDVQKPETLERRYMGKLNKTAIDFMKGLLELNPKNRLNGDTVFKHPYFKDLVADEKFKLKSEKITIESEGNEPNVENSPKKVTEAPRTNTNINIININNYGNITTVHKKNPSFQGISQFPKEKEIVLKFIATNDDKANRIEAKPINYYEKKEPYFNIFLNLFIISSLILIAFSSFDDCICCCSKVVQTDFNADARNFRGGSASTPIGWLLTAQTARPRQ